MPACRVANAWRCVPCRISVLKMAVPVGTGIAPTARPATTTVHRMRCSLAKWPGGKGNTIFTNRESGYLPPFLGLEGQTFPRGLIMAGRAAFRYSGGSWFLMIDGPLRVRCSFALGSLQKWPLRGALEEYLRMLTSASKMFVVNNTASEYWKRWNYVVNVLYCSAIWCGVWGFALTGRGWTDRKWQRDSDLANKKRGMCCWNSRLLIKCAEEVFLW